ncbi:MAG: spermidine synthase [Kiloniellales bacterium]
MITLHRQATDYGEITILRSRDSGSYLYCQDGSYQSEADSRGVSLASYVHAIHGLVTQYGAKDVLIIGCAGGTLATMLTFSGARVCVVDVNPASIVFARRYFSLPDSVPFHLSDGQTFLRETSMAFDAIVVDAYVGSEIPAHFRSQAFFKTALRRLAANGLVLFNVHLADDLDQAADAVGTEMMLAGLRTQILDTPGAVLRNAIVLGGAIATLRKPGVEMPPESSATEIAEELDRMRFRPCRCLPAESR